jgi:hypothetical protein
MRQICLVAEDLDMIESHLRGVFGLEVCYRDPGVGRFGLHNFLMPIGDSFIEVVSPITPGTAGGRFLRRRGGDGGYMVIMQCDDMTDRRAHMAELGVRLIIDAGNDQTDGIQLHPKDVPGAIAELRWNSGEQPGGPWNPAGDHWVSARREHVITKMVAAELQSDDPVGMASRWSEVLGISSGSDEDGHPTLALDDATLRFVEASDGRGEGLGGLDVSTLDQEHVVSTARHHDLDVSDDESLVMLCGVRFRLV